MKKIIKKHCEKRENMKSKKDYEEKEIKFTPD